MGGVKAEKGDIIAGSQVAGDHSKWKVCVVKTKNATGARGWGIASHIFNIYSVRNG
jgi:hypothetical protein